MGESLLTVEQQQEQRQGGGRPENVASDPTATSALAGHPGLGRSTLSYSCQENRSERADPGRITLETSLVAPEGWWEGAGWTAHSPSWSCRSALRTRPPNMFVGQFQNCSICGGWQSCPCSAALTEPCQEAGPAPFPQCEVDWL